MLTGQGQAAKLWANHRNQLARLSFYTPCRTGPGLVVSKYASVLPALMSNSTSYKELKEDFVSNLSGGSVSEICYVTSVAPVSARPLLSQSR